MAKIYQTKSVFTNKILLLAAAILLSSVCLKAQPTTGDYRTNGNGTSWTTANNWDRWNGAAWVANVSYPGQAAAGAGTTVTIQNTHTMILDVTPANSIVNLVIGGGASGTLTIGNNGTGRTLTCTGTVTVNAGATLQSGSGGGSHTLNFQSTLTNSGTINFSNDQITLNVTSTTSNSGTLTFGTNTGIKTFTGAVTNTGTWTSTSLTTAANLVFRGGIASNGGSFSAAGATFNTTAAQSLTGSTAMSFIDVAIPTGITVTNSNTNATSGVTISTSLTGAGTWTQGTTTNILTFGGASIGITAFNANGTGNTVNYNGSGAQTVRAVTYHHLSISNTSTASVAASTANGNLSVSASASLTSSSTLTVTGTSNIAGSITLSSNSARTFTGTVTVSGSWTSTASTTTGNLIFQNGISNSGTFSAGGATFNTTAAQTIGGSGTTSFANAVAITVSASLTGSGTISFASTVTLTTGITLTNSNSNTVTLSNTGASVLTTSGGTATWTQAANSTLSYAGSTISANITLNAVTNTPNTVNYTGATPTIYVSGLTSSTYNNLTYSGTTTGSITSASISGNLTCNSGTFSSSGTITFTGSSTQTVSGSGAFSFTNITMSTGSSANVNVNQSVSVNGAISWTANGLLVMGSSADMTLATTGSITSPNSSRYIQLDGTSGSNSNLIKTTAAATSGSTSWLITYPVGTSTGGYTPVTFTSLTTAPVAAATLSVKPIVTSDVTGRLKRTFRFVVANNANATYFSGGTFNYNGPTVDISSGDVETDYNTVWKLTSGNSWTTVAGSVNTIAHQFSVTGGNTTDASLTSGTYFYTGGSNINAQHTWYSYQTGNYSDFNTWTQDPSGTTFVNPLNVYPATGDGIEILNGFTVTMDLASQTLSTTTIDAGGILDLSTTTGHNLGYISGTGLMRKKGSVLPTGTYTDFVATTGGTIEFYDIGGNLGTATTTFNILKMTNSTSSNISYVLVSDITVNNTFSLSTTGSGTVTWQINDASNASRTITLNGDLNVGSGGKIMVGTGNSGSPTQHAVNMYGNLTNNGTIQFFDPNSAPFTSSYTSATVLNAALRGNAANVTFLGTTDNTIACNSQTDFYRLILDKGTGQQAVLTLNSTAATNMRLYGPADLYSTGGGSNDYSNCALSIKNGTLQITGTLIIPTLIENGGGGLGTDLFTIPQTGALWLNSPNVSVKLTSNVNNNNNDQRLLSNGLFRASNGSTFDGGYSRGIGSALGGSVIIEGSNTTVTIWQYRPIAGGSGIFTFQMTGGTLNVGTTSYTYYDVDAGANLTTPSTSGPDDGPTSFTSQYARFSLGNTNSSFLMSGGKINIGAPTPGASGFGALAGGLDIQSTPANYNVTGGTINVFIPQGATVSPPTTGSRNFTIYSTAPLYNLNVYRVGTTATYYAVMNSPLIILNNFSIQTGNSPAFYCSNNNFTVGGNFAIQSGTTFNTGTTGTPSGTNTITFNGSGAQSWSYNGTLSNLSTVVVNKSAGTLTLSGNTLPNISTLTLTSGTLADGGNPVTVTTALTNNATHTSSGSGKIICSGPTTIGGANGIFGNLRLATNGTVATSGAQTVTGNLELNGSASSILNIASNALSVGGSITTTGTFGTSYFIQTSGLANAGGLTRTGAAGDLLFPVGISGRYTPNTINVTATTHGKVTVRPVNSEHPNVTTTNQSLAYYWRVTSTGYSGITAIAHKSYTFSTSTKNGTWTTYRSARFDASALTWGTNNTTFDATGQTVIPDFNTGTNWAGVVGDQLDGEYTCGNVGAFGGVQPYYSKGNGAWNAATGVWTANSSHSGADLAGPPCSTCPVVIGDGAGINHTITIDANNRSCGTLAINLGSTLDCASFSGLNFGTSTGGSVSGTGTIRVSSAVFPTGDFTNFIGASGGTVEWYGTSKTIPSTYTGPGSTTQNLNTYYNLILNPTAANTLTLPASNLTIYNNWTQQTGTGTVTNNGARTLAITGNLTVSAGTFNLAAGNTTLTVGGNVVNGGTFSTTAGTHTLTVLGGVTNNNTINFNNTGTVALTFTGSNTPVSFGGTGTGGTTLSTVAVNKGSSQTPTVNFTTGGTITTSANWLTLTNGTFDIGNPGTVTYNLSSTSYTIPSTAKLRVSSSTVTVNTTTTDANANDLFLNGALEVAGGTVNVGNQTVNAFNIDIEYAGAGSPTITVSSGSLWVKSSIRRSTSTLTGALVYNQTGGTVTVGGINSSANNSRGVFEIDANTGSSFTLTGTSSLTIQRQTNGTGYADLFINPITSNVSSTSTITVGLTTANTQNNLRVNIAPSIGNFAVANGAGTNAQTVKLYSNPLILAGSLTIPTPSILQALSLDVSIAGDLNCTGTYISGSNTTTFNGTGAQAGTLSSTSTFNNLTISKTAGTTLTLSGTSPTINNLNILTGILDVGTLALNVTRNIKINSSQIGAGSVVVYSTSFSNTITSSGGSFTNLTLGGTAASRTVTVSGNLAINGTLNFSVASRYLFIAANQLTFGTSGAIAGAGSTDFIKTNGVSSDLGVTKNWSAGTSTFKYELGASTNYTPVTFNLNVSSAGTINVIPVNSAHLTANQASSEQLLNYYWTVTLGSTIAATKNGNLVFDYSSSLFTGSGGTLDAAYLDDSNPSGWITSGHGGTATTTQMNFTPAPTTNMPNPGFAYDYTVGTPNTLPNPIVPLYSRLGVANVANQNVGGSWTSASNWTTDTDGDLDLNNPSSVVPKGVPVVILSGGRINNNSNGRIAYKTTINGLLVNGSTIGHNLGVISGTGTFRTNTNTFPAGNYTSFVASGGGTIEYAATMTMNSRSTYNNLLISNNVTTSATDLIINGNLTIGSGNSLDNSVNNADMTVAGDWSNSGTYTAGTGNVALDGTADQAVSGTNAFYGLVINNTGGNVSLSGTGTTTVSSNLTMTSGNLISTSTNTIALGTATLTGGSAGSYIAGPMTKTITSGGSFTAPLGSISPALYRPATIANTSATDDWSFQYFGYDPTNDNYPSSTINPVSIIKSVSSFEYWIISRAGATSADLTLSYGPGSYTPPNVGTVANLRVARWDGSQWDLPPMTGSSGPSGGSTNISGTIFATGVTSFSPVTNASLDVNSPLPVTLLSFTGKEVEEGVLLNWKTASETNNDYFTVLHATDGENFKQLGTVKGNGTTSAPHNYSLIDDSPAMGLNYYRLKQTDLDGTVTTFYTISVNVDHVAPPSVKIYPNPVSRQQTLSVEMNGAAPNQSLDFNITNALGVLINQRTVQSDQSGKVLIQYNPVQLAPGFYIVGVGSTKIKVVVE